MFEPDQMRVHINHVLAVQRNAVPSLVLPAHAFRKKPVQNRKINVKRLQLPTVKFQVPGIQPVLETVKLNKPTIPQTQTKMLPTQLPQTRNLKRCVKIEPFYLLR
jgi:hypothetical protein